MARPTAREQALKDFVEDTRAILMGCDVVVDELLVSTLEYATDGKLMKGVALGLFERLGELRKQITLASDASKRALTIIGDREGEEYGRDSS